MSEFVFSIEKLSRYSSERKDQFLTLALLAIIERLDFIAMRLEGDNCQDSGPDTKITNTNSIK